MDEEREIIRQKRSSMRGWREKGGKIDHQNEIIGAVLVAMVFLGLVMYPYITGSGSDGLTAKQQNNTPAPTSTPGKNTVQATRILIPSPSIKIDAPVNATYNTSTPPLSFIVAGSNLDTVLLRIDEGENITIPHDGTLARIDFANLNPMFIEDFSGSVKRWTETGSWRMESGVYTISGGGFISIGGSEWDDYIVEVKKRIVSGDSTAINVRSDGKNEYRIQPNGEDIALLRIVDKEYQTLSKSKITGINLKEWHTWKIAVNGSKIRFTIDDLPVIEYSDAGKSYQKGYIRLIVWSNASVEYDNIRVYKPLPDGTHNLTIIANNTAGNISYQNVYFAVNTTPVKTEEMTEEDKIGSVGVPLVRSGLEITVKSVTAGDIQTTAWVSVKNLEDKIKPFKLNPGPAILDNNGTQYESIKVSRSSEIAQTDLYPLANREGSIFFTKLKEGTSAKRLLLYVNGERFEFDLSIS